MAEYSSAELARADVFWTFNERSDRGGEANEALPAALKVRPREKKKEENGYGSMEMRCLRLCV